MTIVLLIGCIVLPFGAMMSLTGSSCWRSPPAAGRPRHRALQPRAADRLIKGGIFAGINGRLGESFIITYGAQSFGGDGADHPGRPVHDGDVDRLVYADRQGTNPANVFFALIILCQFC
jgi:hypothetical protein